MRDSKPTGELHLRVAGHTTDWKLSLVDDSPAEEELASWMREGMVIPLRVVEQGSNEPYTLLVNFSLIVAARILREAYGNRSVQF